MLQRKEALTSFLDAFSLIKVQLETCMVTEKHTDTVTEPNNEIQAFSPKVDSAQDITQSNQIVDGEVTKDKRDKVCDTECKQVENVTAEKGTELELTTSIKSKQVFCHENHNLGSGIEHKKTTSTDLEDDPGEIGKQCLFKFLCYLSSMQHAFTLESRIHRSFCILVHACL